MSKAKAAANEVDVYVGSRVRIRRQFIKMTQAKLGQALGLTFQQVQKYETGINRMGASRLQQASQILQVPVSWFFEDAPASNRMPAETPNADSPNLLMDFLATAEGRALINAFSKIKEPKVRRNVVQLVESLTDN
jgi:transcriptional regulator with XRE-family HTH domain